MAELRGWHLPQFEWIRTAPLVIVAARMVGHSWTFAPIRHQPNLAQREPEHIAGQRRKIHCNSEPVDGRKQCVAAVVPTRAGSIYREEGGEPLMGRGQPLWNRIENELSLRRSVRHRVYMPSH